MSKEVNGSNDKATAECEIGKTSECNNKGVNNWDSDSRTVVNNWGENGWEESNTTITSSGWDSNLGKSTVKNLEESNTKVIVIGGRNTSIINWEESNTTGLEIDNYYKIINTVDIYRRYKWEGTCIREEKQITEILTHLAYNNSYRVYGYWICHQWQCEHTPRCGSVKLCENKYKLQFYRSGCKHKPQCQNANECRSKYNVREWQRENLCQREWRKQYDQELLVQYLKEISKRPIDCLGFFIRICDKHRVNRDNRGNRGNLITSFLLYNSKNSNGKPDMEIIRHLVWKNKYRVFGNWRCTNCQKKWRSAYTWMSLQKYIEKTPGKRLNGLNEDYIMQKCKKEKCGGNGIIMSYEPLVRSEENIEHKRLLCAKCQAGEVCLESGTYYGNRK